MKKSIVVRNPLVVALMGRSPKGGRHSSKVHDIRKGRRNPKHRFRDE